ncbi:MAG: DUF1697 domain-containing protein [Acidimicrobiia bacterium]|nr:DUF1697 domain-containing protein [Acidimicrobiia bacterium]
MNTWIAFLRGVNVGRANRMSMADLRASLADDGFVNVRTYIQSGNVVLEADPALDRSAVAAQIGDVIKTRHGFQPVVVVLNPSELEAAISANPFQTSISDAKSVHFFFRNDTADGIDLAAASELAAKDEEFALSDGVFYLHTPAGIGRSKLAAKLPEILGNTATGRNLRSVLSVRDLV